MRPNGGWSSSGTQNMQSSMGQYSTQAGDPAQPVQQSVMTAISLGAFLGLFLRPSDLGRIFTSGRYVGSSTAPASVVGICSPYYKRYNIKYTITPVTATYIQ